MQLRKYRWSKVYESAEEELVAFLAQRAIQAAPWYGEDGTETDRTFDADTQLWCAEGQLVATIDGKTYSLQPGDGLDVPAGSTAHMRIGFGGCTVYESPAAPDHQ